MRAQFVIILLAGALTSATVLAEQPASPSAAASQPARLTLSEAEAKMVAHNRELQAARRALEGVKADVITAGQRPNPTVSLSSVHIYPNPSVPNGGLGSGSLREKQIDTVIGVNQLIERGGKRELRVAAAEKAAQASSEDLADTLRQLRALLRGAYYDLLMFQEKARVTSESAALFSKTLGAAELRLKAGDISPVDVARIRVDALRAQNDARQAQADRAKAQLTLAYLIGSEDAAAYRIEATDPWPPLQEGSSRPELEEVLARRPDVKAAQARIEAAEQARDLARSLRTRDVTVALQYEHFPVNGAGGDENSYGVGVSFPLFARYHFEGEIQRAEVALTAARENLGRVRALALSEIERVHTDMAAAADRLHRFKDVLLIQAQKAADGAEFAYRHGAIGVMDLLDARRTLKATQVDALTAQNDYAKALAAWQAAISDQ